MIAEFEDLCVRMYVVVDDIREGLGASFRGPGPEPKRSDPELIAMTMIGECRGWGLEAELLATFRERGDPFPAVPGQSRYNRRRRHLHRAFNLVRRAVLDSLDLAGDRQCAIDSLPVPAVGFHLAPSCSREWAIHGATLGGVVADFELAPAHVTELEAGAELLSEHASPDAYGDKGHIGRAVKEALEVRNDIGLRCVSRRNRREQTPPQVRRLINGAGQVVETVNSQLAEQFGIERNRAHTFPGLRARLYGKLAAHTLCVYLNRLTGKADSLQIKRLAFN